MTKKELEQVFEMLDKGMDKDAIWETFAGRRAMAKNNKLLWQAANREILNRADLTEEEKISLLLARFEEYTMTCKADAGDYGRFGDLLEVNVKAILAGKWARAKAMHVSAQAVADTTFKGCRVEVGSNGKTFRSADPGKVEPWQNKGFQLEEVLEERVAYVAYAVNAEQVCADADYENKVFMFTREEFLDFLQNAGGLHGLYSMVHVTKDGYALTAQYNQHWAQRFENWIADHDVPTLARFIAENR